MIEGKPSETAQIVCLMRAIEYEWKKENSLLGDRYAQYFLTGRFKYWFSLASSFIGKAFFPTYQWLFDAAILRSALMDDIIKQYSNKYPIVLLGAGFDSRSLRLKEYLKNGIYEIDFPATQKLKRNILDTHNFKTEHVNYLEADFTEKSIEQILEALHLKGHPVVLIWEGVTMYLEEELIYKTIKAVGNYFGTGTIAIADYWRHPFKMPDFLLHPIRDMFEFLWDEPIVFGTTPEELQNKLRMNARVNCNIYDYNSLCKRFGIIGTIYSPFFTAVIEY